MKKVVTIIALLSLAVGAKEPAWYRNGDGGEFYFGRNIPGFVMLNSGNWSWQLRQSGGQHIAGSAHSAVQIQCFHACPSLFPSI